MDMLICNGAPKGLRNFALAALCLGFAAPASAQIYSWRDAKGNMVLSSHRPSGPDVKTFAVPEATAIRATRPVAVSRNRLYDDLINQHAQNNGLRADLVRAVVQVESAFNVYARSAKGALGLMQLMPATIQQYGVRNPFNPDDNLRAGAAYLKQLLDRFENNEQLALAAYNAGPSAVDRHGQTVPPYRETQNYVSRINQITGHPIERRAKQIYKTMVIVDGRPVSRYSDQKPASGGYEVVSR
jgi:soluble lytic murein transglycosylase-like protein